jgi:hypothetical protein
LNLESIIAAMQKERVKKNYTEEEFLQQKNYTDIDFMNALMLFAESNQDQG